MATEPRKISTMVERAMGAGGQMMPEEDSLQIELPSTEEQLPDGIELVDEEVTEVLAVPYDHDANFA